MEKYIDLKIQFLPSGNTLTNSVLAAPIFPSIGKNIVGGFTSNSLA